MGAARVVLCSLTGILLLFMAVFEALVTTSRTGRPAGPVTGRLAELLWRAALRVNPGYGPARGTGMIITLTVVTMWLGLLVAGWYLIFTGSPGCIVNGRGQPAGPWARLYYVAFTISTLGMGDYVPSTPVWQVATAFAAITAFGLATLVITYVASLNSAVAARRQFARHVFGLGDSPAEILQSSWTGREFRLLEGQFGSLIRDMHALVEQQLTYPLVHYFSTRERTAAEWPAIATLNELVFVLDHYIDGAYRPAPLALAPLRRAIDSYLDLVPRSPPRAGSGDSPPLPDTRPLQDAGIPLTSPAGRCEDDLRRRCRIRVVLERQGWPWRLAVTEGTVGRKPQ